MDTVTRKLRVCAAMIFVSYVAFLNMAAGEVRALQREVQL